MKTLLISLSSLKLAFGLLAALCVLIVASALIPQEGLAEHEILNWREALGDRYILIEKLQLNRIYTSPTFFAVLGLLAVNIVLGNIRRFRTVYRTERTLIRARHLGSVVFHLALILIISSVIGNYLFKFRGTLAITEGQTVADSPQDYFVAFAGPLHQSQEGRFQVRMDAVTLADVQQIRGQRTALLQVTPRGAQYPLEAEIAMNRPLNWDGVEFHLGRSVGYSPELLLQDGDGRAVFRGFVRLVTRVEEGEPRFSDFVFIPDEDLRVAITIEPQPQGPELRLVSVERASELLFEGLLAEGEEARFGEYRLSIPRLRQWAYVDVVESPFQNVIFSGFWLSLTGLTVTLIPRVVSSRRAA